MFDIFIMHVKYAPCLLHNSKEIYCQFMYNVHLFNILSSEYRFLTHSTFQYAVKLLCGLYLGFCLALLKFDQSKCEHSLYWR